AAGAADALPAPHRADGGKADEQGRRRRPHEARWRAEKALPGAGETAGRGRAPSPRAAAAGDGRHGRGARSAADTPPAARRLAPAARAAGAELPSLPG